MHLQYRLVGVATGNQAPHFWEHWSFITWLHVCAEALAEIVDEEKLSFQLLA